MNFLEPRLQYGVSTKGLHEASRESESAKYVCESLRNAVESKVVTSSLERVTTVEKLDIERAGNGWKRCIEIW